MADGPLAAYPAPKGRALEKEITALDRHCRTFLALCPFVVLSTATADGHPDVSPRGGAPGFVHVLDDRTLALPDRPGNNRLDSLSKIARNPPVALLCMVPGIDETLRIFGRARIVPVDEVPIDTVEHGTPARTVLTVDVDRAYMHCAKALMRSALWDPGARVDRDAFPTMGEVTRDHGASGPVESQDAMLARYRDAL